MSMPSFTREEIKLGSTSWTPPIYAFFNDIHILCFVLYYPNIWSRSTQPPTEILEYIYTHIIIYNYIYHRYDIDNLCVTHISNPFAQSLTRLHILEQDKIKESNMAWAKIIRKVSYHLSFSIKFIYNCDVTLV